MHFKSHGFKQITQFVRVAADSCFLNAWGRQPVLLYAAILVTYFDLFSSV